MFNPDIPVNVAPSPSPNVNCKIKAVNVTAISDGSRLTGYCEFVITDEKS
jgi:hypothetical protein